MFTNHTKMHLSLKIILKLADDNLLNKNIMTEEMVFFVLFCFFSCPDITYYLIIFNPAMLE